MLESSCSSHSVKCDGKVSQTCVVFTVNYIPRHFESLVSSSLNGVFSGQIRFKARDSRLPSLEQVYAGFLLESGAIVPGTYDTLFVWRVHYLGHLTSRSRPDIWYKPVGPKQQWPQVPKASHPVKLERLKSSGCCMACGPRRSYAQAGVIYQATSDAPYPMDDHIALFSTSTYNASTPSKLSCP